MTALRELAERWKAESGQGDWRRAATYANELLSILDAEGDGGTVGDAWKLAMAVLQSDLYWKLSAEDRAMCGALIATNPHIHTTHPQPARSGGVSDEQAEAMRWALHHIETGNLPIGWNYDRIREAFAAIKSQGESNV